MRPKNEDKMKKTFIKCLFIGGLSMIMAACGQSGQNSADKISFGIYACSPEESSFTAVFSDMKITECMWKAHDGQQPDEE